MTYASGLPSGYLNSRLARLRKRPGRNRRLAATHPACAPIAPVSVGAVPLPKGVAPQTLAAVIIEAEVDGKKLTGSIERELGSGYGSGQEDTTADADVMVWKQTMAGAAPLEQRVRLGSNKAAKWLERTLHRPKHDPAFNESVAFAEHIVEDGLTV